MPDQKPPATPSEEEQQHFTGPTLPSSSPPRPTSRWRRCFWAAAVLATAAVISVALALGLGLGLGLRHHGGGGSGIGAGGSRVLPAVATPDAGAYVMNTSLVGEPATTRYYEFVVEEAMGAPDGVEKLMLVVNGMYPGPTIEANVDDRIVVNVTNLMPNATAIHWHGLFQNGTNYYDGTDAITQCGIPPGESMVYNFTFDDWTGSTWWHAHADTQYTDGITGALVVHGRNESVPAYDGDLVVQISDLYHGFSPDLLAYYFTPGGIDGTPGNEPVPDGGTINGVGQYGSHNTSFFNFTLQPDTTYRLRIINPGTFVPLAFSVDGHTLSVVEGDGTPVEPVAVSSVSVAVAQRYSVLLRTNQTAGAYWIRAALDTTQFTYDNPGCQTEIRGVIRYGVAEHAMPDVALLDNPPALPSGSPGELDDGDLVPVGGAPAPDPTFTVYFTMSMEYPAGEDESTSKYLAFINQTSWAPLANTSSLFSHLGNATPTGSSNFDGSQLVTTVNDLSVVEMIIDNLDDGDHPFHLHGYKFWVMDGGAGRWQGETPNNTAPMLRDTVVIPAYNWMILRFVADNPGYWAFHCHIQWHMAAGLLFQFNILPSKSAQFDIPQYMLDMCGR